VTARALVGPLPTIRFMDGTAVVYSPPRDTCDPRAYVCSDHHPACDCGEAEWSEQRTEWRLSASEARQTEQALEAVGELHRSYKPPYGGRICRECHSEWPCPTFRLAADSSWLLALMERQGEA
jgi:hypothetical protein